MNLRPPTYSDCEFIAEVYESWVDSDRGRIFPVDVRNWIKRFRKSSSDEVGLVAELRGTRVGFVLYGLNKWGVCVIYELVIHEHHRGKGVGRATWVALRDHLTAKGVQAAEFDGLPGAISAKITDGYFEQIGQGMGPHSGLPTLRGRVYKDSQL